MKGTIDATLPDAVQTLMNDGKEAAEHATIVDLIRNDLSIVASHVRVERYRYIDVLQTNRGPILQTSSEICGELPEDYKRQLGDILFQHVACRFYYRCTQKRRRCRLFVKLKDMNGDSIRE